jgi:hypothetical protein
MSTVPVPTSPSSSGAKDPLKFNKKEMVEYMMLTNKAFEHCISQDLSKFLNALIVIKKNNFTKMLGELNGYKNDLNSPNKNNSSKAVDAILFIIIQHCLGDKDNSSTLAYTPYKKNVIHNIIFNILKKEIINDFETFLLIGIIEKIRTRPNITLAHIDTLIYMLDKLFLYKFPKDKNNKGGLRQSLTEELTALSSLKGVDDIYNRYVVYLNLIRMCEEKIDVYTKNKSIANKNVVNPSATNPLIIAFKIYLDLYKDTLNRNSNTFTKLNS